VRLRDKGPRVIDVDVLFFGSVVMAVPGLEIPHPAVGERRFVLEPLAELAAELQHPVTRRTVGEMLADVQDQSVRRL
jgi:2-amino-4-hydroxy-6-hydroxymethyldihydropteridine diphosphokinase